MADDKILEKLRKLMNLKESASEIGNVGEANAAAAGIERLLTQYNLSMTDIPEQDKIDNPIIIEDTPFFHERCKGSWYEDLITEVAEDNLCQVLITRTRHNFRYHKTKLRIVGRKNNVEITLYLVSFLSNSFIAQGMKEYPNYRWKMLKGGITPKTEKMYMKAYLTGCIIGYKEKIENLKKDFDSGKMNDLVLSSEAEVNDFLKDMNLGTEKSNRNLNIDLYATNSGMKTGMETEINKGIYAESIGDDRRIC